ncbi:transcription factor bHLH94-like isoform X2 [Carica papaya]|uniref:transcription factor bHLH94-like isoform X2 n=1 Tax=Carica papaya TaxID=3649 RepID=UPI000B8CB1B8|nr:transcription factor bHLH94-like isoform X2 [Carica papaya]
MALEAVVFQQDQLFTGYTTRDLYNLFGAGNWSFDGHFGFARDEQDQDRNFLQNQTENLDQQPPNSTVSQTQFNELHHPNSSSCSNQYGTIDGSNSSANPTNVSTITRSKRRRSKSRKNKEEIENQRMTHIAVERNRRKQMNEYLSVLRSLMPESYVQRGDQASIIGGAINFVKELEHRLQLLGSQKEITNPERSDSVAPFSEFFTFPQYSTSSSSTRGGLVTHNSVAMNEEEQAAHVIIPNSTQCAIADIEVTMVESHANLKIRSRRRPKQLLKVVSGLHAMRLTVLHLNVSTVDQTVLYSLSVKVRLKMTVS